MAISLAIDAGAFLGHQEFRSPKPRRVVFLSAESGKTALRMRANSICKSIGLGLSDLGDWLCWDFKAPKFADIYHQHAVSELLKRREAEVLLVDPAYFCIDGTDAGNLFKQVEQLKPFTDLCADHGVLLVLAHHMSKQLRPSEIPQLEHISWAGFQEFAAQWILLNRRSQYRPGTGKHDLIMSVGSRALFGGGGFHAVDIFEGDYTDLAWDVAVSDGFEAMKAAQSEEASERGQRKAAGNRLKVDKAKRKIRSRFGDGEPFSQRRFDRQIGESTAACDAMFEMQQSGEMETATFQTGKSKQTCNGFRLVHSDESAE